MTLVKKGMLILVVITVYLGCGKGDKVCKSQGDCLSCETCNRGCCLPKEGAICEPTCLNGDGICPAFCNATNDSDCKPVCGNGITEPGELCDGFDCPTSCTAIDACKPLQLVGSIEQCNAQCVPLLGDANASIQTCTNDDGCCPVVCTFTTDNDCSPWTTEKVYTFTPQGCDPSNSFIWASATSFQLDKNDNEHFLTGLMPGSYDTYLYRNNNEWNQEQLPMYGFGISLLLDSNGIPYIIIGVWPQGAPGVGYYYKDHGLWLLKTVASATTGYTIRYTAMAIDQDGKFHFAFTESNDTDKTYKLNYAKPVGDTWEVQTVEDRDQAYLYYIFLDKNNNPNILYGIQSLDVWARFENSVWKKVVLTGLGSPYAFALDVDGIPTFCYNTDNTYSTIKCGKVINDAIETITEFQGGMISTIAIDSQSNIHILYRVDDQLKYIKWNGNALVDEHIVAKNITSASIALDKNDKPVIVYGQNCDVMVGHWSYIN